MVDHRATDIRLHRGVGWCSAETALVKHSNHNDANGYYQALGVAPTASREEIKTAYRRLAKRTHPDNGGDEELFKFVSDIASVLLTESTKVTYDSVGSNAIYLGKIECEELARNGRLKAIVERGESVDKPSHWACYTSSGIAPGAVTDAWVDLCREVAPAAGYRGKIRVGVIEGGPTWPCDPAFPWGILSIAYVADFVVFQRGVEPNRLHALCAMMNWKKHTLNQKAG